MSLSFCSCSCARQTRAQADPSLPPARSRSRSARHVPARILAVQDIPHTINGKKVEVPIKKLLNGAELQSINLETLRNPECLREYVEVGRRLRGEVQ